MTGQPITNSGKSIMSFPDGSGFAGFAANTDGQFRFYHSSEQKYINEL